MLARIRSSCRIIAARAARSIAILDTARAVFYTGSE